MTLPRPASLRARMTWSFTWVFAIFVGVACGGISGATYQSARRDTRLLAREAAVLVVRERKEKTAFASVFDEVREQPRLANVSIRVLDASGRTVATNRRLTVPWPHAENDGWQVATQTSAPFTVVAGVDWKETKRALQRQALRLVAFGIVTVGAASLLAWGLVGRTLRPIGLLANQADVAVADPFHIRLTPSSQDAEVRHLVGTLNGMLHRLRDDALTREQFYAAAAHELRTPLTVLSGNIEFALSRPRAVRDYTETLLELQRETKRMISLSEGLLLLNRLQMQTATEETGAADVAEECRIALGAVAPLTAQRNLRVRTKFSAHGVATGAPASHVAIIVQNLVENAAKYAPAGGRLFVSVQREGRVVRLCIFNEYEEAGDLVFSKAFEPFYRSENARASETSGNGLGLAICRRLAEKRGWDLQLAPEGNGVAATVLFPVLP